MTDEVSRLTAPGLGVCVEGDDVEMFRFCGGCWLWEEEEEDEEEEEVDLLLPDASDVCLLGTSGGVLLDLREEEEEEEDADTGGGGAPVPLGKSDRTWVCRRVLTTSSGHVMAPARPPAPAPVKKSSGRPMSRLPFH